MQRSKNCLKRSFWCCTHPRNPHLRLSKLRFLGFCTPKKYSFYTILVDLDRKNGGVVAAAVTPLFVFGCECVVFMWKKLRGKKIMLNFGKMI